MTEARETLVERLRALAKRLNDAGEILALPGPPEARIDELVHVGDEIGDVEEALKEIAAVLAAPDAAPPQKEPPDLTAILSNAVLDRAWNATVQTRDGNNYVLARKILAEALRSGGGTANEWRVEALKTEALLNRLLAAVGYQQGVSLPLLEFIDALAAPDAAPVPGHGEWVFIHERGEWRCHCGYASTIWDVFVAHFNAPPISLAMRALSTCWRCRLCAFTVSEDGIEDNRRNWCHRNAVGEPARNNGTAYCPRCEDETLVEHDADGKPSQVAAPDAAGRVEPPTLGLNVDMLDVDRLKNWADNMETHGYDLTRWASVSFVVGRLRDMAKRLEQEIRDVGELRWLAAVPAAAPPLALEWTDEQLRHAIEMADPTEWANGDRVYRLTNADCDAMRAVLTQAAQAGGTGK